MTGSAVLIAGFSGRALAVSARHAGFRPFVADCFGDVDTGEAAQELIRVPGSIRAGLKSRALIDALEQLSQRAGGNVLGLVLSTGFEANPRLLRALADRFAIIGNSAQTVRRCKDPKFFFPLLRKLGIVHPETQLSPPSDDPGWVRKGVGGSGGVHIYPCSTHQEQGSRVYFQRIIPGVPISLAGVVGKRGTALAFCRQWTAPTERAPYRFGGLLGPISLDPDTEARMIDIALELSEELGLVGFVSFDFVLSADDIFLLEVNPRFTAALDVLDDRSGTLLRAHFAACEDHDAAALFATSERPSGTTAIGYLYADGGELKVPQMTWPVWSTDRPPSGTVIKVGQPLAGVIARASGAREAEGMCRRRLGELEDLLYGPAV